MGKTVTIDAVLYKLIVDTLATILDERDAYGFINLSPAPRCDQCAGEKSKPPFKHRSCLYHTARAVEAAARRRRWPKRWP